ncbi:CRAL-TRIO domain-containing protein [Jimgerdemannia flammicorona]|uniref:CRAL-TRIO domain-containing protein n=1 Tax=Jimgerdemannia flammicorona TaxID=994334 RepID=A0A433QTY6_9FUNG|nr:CRAL-TRIO domain-containing protein [Jimgerdemannia flammicorona]
MTTDSTPKPDPNVETPVTHIPVLEPSSGIQLLLNPALDESQQHKLKALREHVQVQVLPETDDYHAKETAFLSDSTLQRYLRARKWDLESAKKQLDGSILWRRSYKPEMIDPKEVEPEVGILGKISPSHSLTGKMYLNGFDKHGRPTLYLKPRYENTKPSAAQIRNVVFNLERATRLMPEGVDNLNIIIDMAGSSMSTSPGVGISKQFLDVLGNHYPERLGVACIVHCECESRRIVMVLFMSYEDLVSSPWFFWPFFKVISPFIDPITRSKIKFVDPKHVYEPAKDSSKEHEWVSLFEYYTPEQLEKDFNGGINFKWDFEKYWQALLDKTGNPF